MISTVLLVGASVAKCAEPIHSAGAPLQSPGLLNFSDITWQSADVKNIFLSFSLFWNITITIAVV